MQEIRQIKRFFIVSLATNKENIENIRKDLSETYALVHALKNGEVVDIILQRDYRPHQKTYIGSGKAQEIAKRIKEEHIDVIVLNDWIRKRQIFALKKIFWKANLSIQVWDRVDLILEIFSRHAHTAEAKLQIELAKMQHMGPRIYGMGKILSQQGGGIGTSGIGETNVELMKRHWKSEMRKVQEKLQKLSKDREEQLQRRKKSGLRTISLIGYTNAGKSSLFNLLTKKQTLVENALFATLDSHVGKMYLGSSSTCEIILTDTIGFIQNLPPRLMSAFHSTLLESMHADMLLHIIDISDPDMRKKIAVVEQVLFDLGIDHKKRIYVFNKIDRASSVNRNALVQKYHYFNPVFISIKTGEGKEKLEKNIIECLPFPSGK